MDWDCIKEKVNVELECIFNGSAFEVCSNEAKGACHNKKEHLKKGGFLSKGRLAVKFLI